MKATRITFKPCVKFSIDETINELWFQKFVTRKHGTKSIEQNYFYFINRKRNFLKNNKNIFLIIK
jgi:hypothetical protein